MIINVRDYWPFDLVGTTKKRLFSYTDPTGTVPAFSSSFYYDSSTAQLVCSDFNDKGEWQDDWRMIIDKNGNVAEVADWYPQTNKALSFIFGPVRKEVLSSPILWGGRVEVPTVISNSIVVNKFGSTPPQTGSGFQVVNFERILPCLILPNGKTYSNILQFVYSQTWGTKTTGGRYWMAKGVGPIAISWLGFDPTGHVIVTEPGCSAVVTEEN